MHLNVTPSGRHDEDSTLHISFAGPFRVSEAILLGITRTLLGGWLVGWVVVGPERFNPLPVGGSLPNLHGR